MRYEFSCNECGTTVEKDKPLLERNNPEYCISCGSEMVRCISSVQFKVNGFNVKNGYSKNKQKLPPGY